MTETDPTFEPRSIGFFAEWYIQVTWPDGRTQQVQSFDNEAHARGWIATQSQAWIAEQRAKRISGDW